MADLQPICPSPVDVGHRPGRRDDQHPSPVDARGSDHRHGAAHGGGPRHTPGRSRSARELRPPAAGLASPPGQPHRARLVQAVREVVEEVSRADVLSAATGPADDPSGARARIESIVAAGMLSSEVGLVAVPHVQAPAGLEDLARGVAIGRFPEIVERPIYFVPGVRTAAADGPDGWFQADVMRGEECETLGAYAALRARGRARNRPLAGLSLAGLSHQAGRSGSLGADHTEPDQLGGRIAPGPGAAYAPGRQPARDTARRSRPRHRGGRGPRGREPGTGTRRVPGPDRRAGGDLQPDRTRVILDRRGRRRRCQQPGSPSHPHAGSTGLGGRAPAVTLALRRAAGRAPRRDRRSP